MAGLRTNALVALGAAGFVVFAALTPGDSPTRVAAQIVSGIGFLGAGVILREGVNVHGLNTAATLWCSAMVGTFAGAGQMFAAAAACGFVVLTNLFLETRYLVEITCRGAEEAHVRALPLHAIQEAGLGLRQIDSADIPETAKVAVSVRAMAARRDDSALERIVGRVSLDPYVSAATWAVERAIPEA